MTGTDTAALTFTVAAMFWPDGRHAGGRMYHRLGPHPAETSIASAPARSRYVRDAGGLFQIDPARHVLVAVHLDDHGEVCPTAFLDPRDRLADESAAAGGVPAVFVGAQVTERRQELVKQVPVRAVHFDPVEAGLGGAPSRLANRCDQLTDLRQLQRPRQNVARMILRKLGDCRWRDRPLVRVSPAGLPPAVAELHCALRRAGVDGVGQALEAEDVPVVPQVEHIYPPAPAGVERGHLDRDQRGPAPRPPRVMRNRPLAYGAVDRCEIRDRRRPDQTVLQLHPADADRLK